MSFTTQRKNGVVLYDINTKKTKTLTDVFDAVNTVEGGLGFGANYTPEDKTAETLLPVTISTDNTPTIASAVTVTRQDYTKFQLLSSRDEFLSTSAGYLVSTAPSGADISRVRSFFYDGQEVEFQWRYIQGAATIIADGEVVAEVNLFNAMNQPRWFKIDLGSAKLRKIEVHSRLDLAGSIAIEPNTVMYPTRDKGYKIGVLGDSITDGTGSQFARNFVYNIRRRLGFNDISNFGIGGSGYINNTGNGKFVNRIQEVSDAGFEYLMVAGGINDLAQPIADFSTAVDEFYTRALELFPASNIIIVSNWSNVGTINDSATTAMRDVLKAKAESIGAKFIDAINDAGNGWLTGTGNAVDKEGDGNCDALISDDGTHPTNAGHNVYGVNISASLSGKELIL